MIANNSVEKGVHLSNEFALQPEGTMRYSLNGRITGLKDGDYAWETISGNIVKFSVGLDDYSPHGYIEGQDRLFVFSAKNNNNGEGEIGAVDIYGTYTPLIVGNLNFNTGFRISGFYDYETERKKNIYFTDEYNNPRWVNTFELYNTSLGELEDDRRYIVTTGVVRYEGNSLVRGDTFVWHTGSAISTDANTVIVPYVDISLLDFSPDVSFPDDMSVTARITGNLYYGNYYLAYRYRTREGYVSRYSPLSGPYTITKTNHNTWHGNESGDYLGISTVGLSFRLGNVDPRFEIIDVIAFLSEAEYTMGTGRNFTSLNIEDASLISDEYYHEFDFIDYIGAEITIEQYGVSSVTIEKCRELNSVKRFSTMGNITEEDELSIGQTLEGASSVKAGVYWMPFDVIAPQNDVGDISLVNPNTQLTSLYKIKDGNSLNEWDGAERIIPNIYYKVTAGAIGYGPVPSVTYYPGDVFRGLEDYITFSYSTSEETAVYPVIHVAKYYNHLTGETVYDDKLITSAEGYRGLYETYMAGYWGNETYRIGILPISKTGKIHYVRHIADIKIPERVKDKNGILNEIMSDGSIVEHDTGIIQKWNGSTIHDKGKWKTAKIVNLLVDVDLTDIIDDISGFCIVRSERDKVIISEGMVEPTIFQEANPLPNSTPVRKVYREPYMNRDLSHIGGNGWGGGVIQNKKDVVVYITYDHLMGDSYAVADEDYFDYARGHTGDDNYRETHGSFNTLPAYGYEKYTWNKFYDEVAWLTDNKSWKIKNWVPLEIGTEEIYFDTSQTSTWFKNFTTAYYNKYNPDYGGRGLLLQFTTNMENGLYFSGRDNGHGVTILKHIRPKTNLYGGTNGEALERSRYMMIGHYQQVDEDFKNAIKTPSGDYIAKNIQIFGGDTYIVPFHHIRIMTDWYDIGKNSNFNEHGSNQVVFPVQTNINPYFRNDRVVITKGTYWPTTSIANINGVGASSYGTAGLNIEIHEDYTWNKAYAVSKDLTQFPGLPYKFISSNNRQPNRLRYSNRKVNGEQVNSFISMPPLNFLDVPGNGEIVNIREKNNRLFVWKDDAILYVPVDERALITDTIGAAIQIGVGSTFVRSDELEGFFGNQHRFGLTETIKGFLWYDERRKSVIFMDYNGSAVNVSLMRGWDSFFQNNTPSDLSSVRDYVDGTGIVSNFDEKTKTAYISLLSSRYGSYTIGYNITNHTFTGFYDPVYWFMTKLRQNFFVSPYKNRDFSLEDESSDTIFGSTFQSKLSFVINGNMRDSKRFYSHVSRGSNYFFDQVTFSVLYDFLTGTFNQIVSEEVSALNDYEYLNGEWRFGTPDSEIYPRFEDIYMLIEFVKNSTTLQKVRLYQLLTNYIKLH